MDDKPIHLNDRIWRKDPNVTYLFGRPREMSFFKKIKWILKGRPKTKEYWKRGFLYEPGEE